MLPRHHEERFRKLGYRLIAGVDEVGRGALAGPVVAAAVLIPEGITIPGARDSKALSRAARAALCEEVRGLAQSVGIGRVEPAEIDSLNILRATHRAMAEALAALDPPADFALIDGPRVQGIVVPHQCLVKGDQCCFLIAAASIVAKVARDQVMVDLEARHPGYGFADHKGYGTSSHREALRRLGPSPVHRRSFAPVAEAAHPVLK